MYDVYLCVFMTEPMHIVSVSDTVHLSFGTGSLVELEALAILSGY